MHKRLILIFCLLLLGGCKQIIGDTNYVAKVNNCLKEDIITNGVGLGYKFYVPRGVKKLKDYDYNQIFLIDDTYLYLYVDVISFYYKEELIYPEVSDVYYYEIIEFNGKKGYILIDKKEDEYYFNIVYNYSKIEGYTKENKLNKIVTLSSIILNNIDYNDKIIEKILKGDLGQVSEIDYEIKKPEGASSNFSQYLEESVQADENDEESEQLPDE